MIGTVPRCDHFRRGFTSAGRRPLESASRLGGLQSVPRYGFIVVAMDTDEINSLVRRASTACSLPTAERPLRVAEFDALFKSAVRGVSRVHPRRVRITLDATPRVAAQVADLAMRESACCAFYTFTLTAAAGQLDLDLTVPAEHVEVLDAVEAWAGTGTLGAAR